MNAVAEAEGLWRLDRTEAMPRILEVYDELAEQAASTRWGVNKHIDREEFVVAAKMGLWQAAMKYNPDGGSAFTTFCQLRMHGSMSDREREADTAPVKLRLAEKRGDVGPLPAMLPMDSGGGSDAYDLPEVSGEAERALEENIEALNAILDDAPLWASMILRDALECRLDLVELGERYGCGFESAVDKYSTALQAAKALFVGQPVRAARRVA